MDEIETFYSWRMNLKNEKIETFMKNHQCWVWSIAQFDEFEIFTFFLSVLDCMKCSKSHATCIFFLGMRSFSFFVQFLLFLVPYEEGWFHQVEQFWNTFTFKQMYRCIVKLEKCLIKLTWARFFFASLTLQWHKYRSFRIKKHFQSHFNNVNLLSISNAVNGQYRTGRSKLNVDHANRNALRIWFIIGKYWRANHQ